MMREPGVARLWFGSVLVLRSTAPVKVLRRPRVARLWLDGSSSCRAGLVTFVTLVALDLPRWVSRLTDVALNPLFALPVCDVIGGVPAVTKACSNIYI